MDIHGPKPYEFIRFGDIHGYKRPRSEKGSELDPGGLPPPRPSSLGAHMRLRAHGQVRHEDGEEVEANKAVLYVTQ